MVTGTEMLGNDNRTEYGQKQQLKSCHTRKSGQRKSKLAKPVGPEGFELIVKLLNY